MKFHLSTAALLVLAKTAQAHTTAVYKCIAPNGKLRVFLQHYHSTNEPLGPIRLITSDGTTTTTNDDTKEVLHIKVGVDPSLLAQYCACDVTPELVTIADRYSGSAESWIAYDLDIPSVGQYSYTFDEGSKTNQVLSPWPNSQVFPATILTPLGSSASCMGDPHFNTWSNVWYDFHGQCDLVFLTNPHFASGKGMDIHIRTKIRQDMSFIESAAIRIGADILEVSSYAQYSLNGVGEAEMPAKLDDYTIKYEFQNKKHQLWHLELGEGKEIVIKTFKDMVSVKVVGARWEEFGQSKGLLGEFITGKWAARNGTEMTDPDAFGNEWQVQEGEAKLFETERTPQYPQKCIMPGPKSSESRRRLGEATAVATVEKACQHWGDQKELCVFDVMATGDLEQAEAGAF